MKTVKILFGAIAGAVALFLLGWLIYGLLLPDYIKANYNQCANRPMEEWYFWAMIVSELAYGFLLAIILSWSKAKGITGGLKIGGIIGILIAVSMDFSMYSMSTAYLNFSAVCVDVIVYTVMSAISGIVVALVMGIGKKEA